MTRRLFQTDLELSDAELQTYDYGERSSGDTHGVVLTRRHVVELILELAGYSLGKDLTRLRLLEPACGEGAFLIPAVERLVHCAKREDVPLSSLHESILAFDVDPAHVDASRNAVEKLLSDVGASEHVATSLTKAWVRRGDFLLSRIDGKFDAVVGNPPYVRIENLSPELQAEYRAEYRTLFDRADLYVPFIERGLRLLSERGRLSFVCADRWTRNRYGRLLRKLITTEFQVLCYINCQSASLFETEVAAYPSIFAIGRGNTETVPVATLTTGSEKECRSLQSLTRQTQSSEDDSIGVEVYDQWFKGDDPWVLNTREHHDTLRELESRFGLLCDGEATKACIGVATGCDRVFIVDGNADIEPSRLVPLVMRSDIDQGRVLDAGRFVINTFGDDGKIVDLREFPRLKKYLDNHADSIKRRAVAKKSPGTWYRTIDRVYPERAKEPKLLIPDIAGSCEVTYEAGQFHPHHNLYYILSSTWDLEVLGGLLSSKVALFFVWSYAVKMRGGYLRFQAQYLRRIRAPRQSDMSENLKRHIRAAFRARNFSELDVLAMEAYKLDHLPDFSFVDTRGK